MKRGNKTKKKYTGKKNLCLRLNLDQCGLIDPDKGAKNRGETFVFLETQREAKISKQIKSQTQ